MCDLPFKIDLSSKSVAITGAGGIICGEFAKALAECGMDVKTLSEILGHKNPTVTLNRYAHSLMEHKADMMNRLGKLLQ